jgi:hypothetical protein
MNSSDIGPGPLGILATRPTAEAPYSTAILASYSLFIQQILILVIIIFISPDFPP